MTNITVTEAKAKLLQLIRMADKNMDHFILSRNGKPMAVLMSIDEYEGWQETLDIISDKNAYKDILKAKEEIKKGDVYTFEEVFKNKKRS